MPVSKQALLRDNVAFEKIEALTEQYFEDLDAAAKGIKDPELVAMFDEAFQTVVLAMTGLAESLTNLAVKHTPPHLRIHQSSRH